MRRAVLLLALLLVACGDAVATPTLLPGGLSQQDALATITAGTAAQSARRTETALAVPTETSVPIPPTNTSAPPADIAIPPTMTEVPPTATEPPNTFATAAAEQDAQRAATRTAVASAGITIDPFSPDDVNCSDFETQATAQLFMEASGEDDRYNLDGNPKDGKACESLP